MSKTWLMILSFLIISGIALYTFFKPSKTETVSIKIKNQVFNLEIARTVKQQTIGLMNRSNLPKNSGMIFVFGFEMPQSFWMKNTLIPLDIIFLDKTGSVINIAQGKPQSLDLVSSSKPAKYVIELNAGTAQKINLQPGDQIDLSPLDIRN